MKKDKNVLVISFQSLSANSGAGMARLGYFLSAELHKKGLLHSFIISSKGKFDTPFPSEPVSVFSRYYLFILNKLVNIFKIPAHKSRYIQELLFDWFCSFKLNRDIITLVSTNSYLPRTLKKANRLGIRSYVIPANPDDNYIYGLVKEEQQKFNIHFTDAYTYKRRLDYYKRAMQQATNIICCFPVTKETYLGSPYKDKVVDIPGHLKPDFKEVILPEKIYNKEFRVSYLAYSVLLKGLPYLLEAWREIMKQPDMENLYLHIGGNMDTTVKNYVQNNFADIKQVHYEGLITNVPKFLEDKDLFVVPSLVEGGPVTALEAAHYGVPVIITRNCGSRGFFEQGDTGWVIPIRDANSIKENILWAYRNRKEAVAMGLKAKTSLDAYKTEYLVRDIADRIEKEMA